MDPIDLTQGILRTSVHYTLTNTMWCRLCYPNKLNHPLMS